MILLLKFHGGCWLRMTAARSNVYHDEREVSGRLAQWPSQRQQRITAGSGQPREIVWMVSEEEEQGEQPPGWSNRPSKTEELGIEMNTVQRARPTAL